MSCHSCTKQRGSTISGPFVFLRLHPLKGDQGGRWAVDVSGNWRITFSVNADGAFDELDYEDYH